MFAVICTLFLFYQLECNTKCFDFHYAKREKKKKNILIKKEIEERDFDFKIVITEDIKKEFKLLKF